MWDRFETKEEMAERAKHYRCQYIDCWRGAGWYWIHTYEKPCPRGCCYDSCISIVSAAERFETLNTEVKEKILERQQAKQYVREST